VPSLSARISLLSNALALIALLVAWMGWLPPMPLPFLAHKALHLAGLLLFGGNLVVGPLWLAFAWASGDRELLAFAARSLAAADIWLTTPGVQLALWNGLFASQAFGGIRAQPWLAETAALMVFVSLLSCTVVLYWQERMISACEARQDPGRSLWWWGLWGTALSLPLGWVFWLMISKRALLLGYQAECAEPGDVWGWGCWPWG
jgi:uncharacterized membrane protein